MLRGGKWCRFWAISNGTGIVFIGNMLSWLSFHNFV